MKTSFFIVCRVCISAVALLGFAGPLPAKEKEEAPVLPDAWVTRIQEMVKRLSQREGKPFSDFAVGFNKDGSLYRSKGWSLASIPTDAVRTSNIARSHHTCFASFDAKGELKLSDKPGVAGGPDCYDPLPLQDFPKACDSLRTIRRLQRAFITCGLDYALEAVVVTGEGGKSWCWSIEPREEQMPNVIYSMSYYPDTGELRSCHLEEDVAKKLEAAAQKAGMRLVWIKNRRDL